MATCYLEMLSVAILSVGLGASINVAKPPKGSTVAIFGLGAVGLAASFLIRLLIVLQLQSYVQLTRIYLPFIFV